MKHNQNVSTGTIGTVMMYVTDPATGQAKMVSAVNPIPTTANSIADTNSTTTLLAASGTFTGEWIDVLNYDSVVVAVKTDQNGSLTVQFSPDGVNQDSTLTRYYRTNQIEAPHRFTVTRQYARVTFTNTSVSDQTYLRLQTMLGDKSDLNAPLDSTLAQDFDAIATRPTDYHYETALGRRQGASTWNKFGYNLDVDTAASETIWEPGGTFARMTTADTLDLVSSSVADDDGSTGANSLVLYGVDENWETQTEVISLNGIGAVTTVNQWLGLNRAAIFLAGTGLGNAGKITITATSAATIQATIPIGQGTTQQCLFFVPVSHQALIDWLYINVNKISAGGSPRVTLIGEVFSAVSNAMYEVYRTTIDTAVENTVELKPSQPFIIGEKSILTFKATTTVNNTEANVRFSLILVRDVDSV